MTRKKRIEYLIVTLCVLFTSFLIYGFIGSVQPLINDDKLSSFLFFGGIGGFGFSMLLSTIILTVNFFTKRSLIFKTIAAILWPITFGCAVYAGLFCYIPYQIYNIVKIIKEKPIANIDENA